MARKKKYNVILSDDELKQLKSVIRKKKTSKTVRCRCQILIDLDEAHGKAMTMSNLQDPMVSALQPYPIQ